jgi:hypothetical protein
MGPRLEEARRLLKPSGSFFVHLDYREVHYCKVLLDQMLGRESFINEIIWAAGIAGYAAQGRNRAQELVGAKGTARRRPILLGLGLGGRFRRGELEPLGRGQLEALR